MTENKIFEVRDRATFLVVLVTKIHHRPASVMSTMYSDNERRIERLIHRIGFGENPLYLYQPLDGACKGMVSYDPHSWPQFRTHKIAHAHIEKNWDDLEDGAVICVEHIEGERDEPKKTDLTAY